MDSALEVGKKLVEFANHGRWFEAVKTLYSADIVGIEACSPQPDKRQIEGLAAVMAHGEWFRDNHDIHSAEARGPWPHDNRFIVYFKLDVTTKGGPMSGKRFTMEEAGLYTVQNGKVVKAEFFYQGG